MLQISVHNNKKKILNFQNETIALRVRIVSYQACELPFVHIEAEILLQIQNVTCLSLQLAIW